MNLRSFVLFAMLMLSAVCGFAQYGTERDALWFNVRSFPDVYVPMEQRTYFVDVKVPQRVGNVVSAPEIADKVVLDGWTRVFNPNKAFLCVHVSFDTFLLEGYRAEDRSTVKTEKDGTKTRYPKYLAIVDYSLPINVWAEMQGGQRVSLWGTGSGKTVKHFDTGRSSNNDRDAIKFAKDNSSAFVEQIISSEVDDAVMHINKAAARSFCYQTTVERIKIYHLDSKKSEFFEQQAADVNSFKSICKNSNAVSQPGAEDVELIINDYVEIINKLDDKEKKQKKAKVDLMVSVANLYLFLDKLDLCEHWAKRLVDEYNEEEGSDIIDDVTKVRKLFDKYKVDSRHFAVNAPVVEDDEPVEQKIEIVQTELVVEKVVEKVVENPVASVTINGETRSFATFNEAWLEARRYDGVKAHVKLLNNLVESGYFETYVLTRGDIVELDLNGFNIFGDLVRVFELKDGASLTIGDNTGKSKLNFSREMLIMVYDNCHLTINGGYFQGKKCAIYMADCTVTINGGTFVAEESAIVVDGKGKLVLNGGEFDCNGDNCKTISVGKAAKVYMDPGLVYEFYDKTRLSEINADVLKPGRVVAAQ